MSGLARGRAGLGGEPEGQRPRARSGTGTFSCGQRAPQAAVSRAGAWSGLAAASLGGGQGPAGHGSCPEWPQLVPASPPTGGGSQTRPGVLNAPCWGGGRTQGPGAETRGRTQRPGAETRARRRGARPPAQAPRSPQEVRGAALAHARPERRREAPPLGAPGRGLPLPEASLLAHETAVALRWQHEGAGRCLSPFAEAQEGKWPP